MVDVKIDNPELVRAVEAFLNRQDRHQASQYPITASLFEERRDGEVRIGYRTAHKISVPTGWLGALGLRRKTEPEVVGLVTWRNGKTQKTGETVITGSRGSIRFIERGIRKLLKPSVPN